MHKFLKLTSILLFVSIFILTPVIFYVYQNDYLKQKADVKGISTSLPSENGTYLNVISNFGNWEMYKYLCVDIEECSSSLNSGEYWGLVSGGKTLGYVYNIDSSKINNEDYKYLKVFVKSSWGTLLRMFEPTIISTNEDIISASILNELEEYTVVLIPIDSINKDMSNIIQFSD